MLDSIISKYSVSYNLVKTLKTTNAKLWDIEDKIRIKERDQCFDAEFIELARSVYITNDERCRIKNNISALFNDDIMDVKSYVDFAPAPSPKTNPSLSASNGLEAVSGLSFLVDKACIELNPPIPAIVTAASEPPEIMTSHIPKRM